MPGVPERIDAAGVWTLPVAAALLIALLASVAPWPRVRGLSLAVASPLLGAAAAWALGGAAQRVLAGQPALARASLAPGAWVLLTAVPVLWLAGAGLPVALRRVRAAAAAVGVALALAAIPAGGLTSLSLAREFAVRADSFWALAAGHGALAASSLLAATLIGLPLGLLASRRRQAGSVVLAVTGAIQTVPSLALLGLLVVPLAALGSAFPALRDAGIRGIGPAPGFIALTLYGLLPVIRGTHGGLAAVDPAVVDAGRGMGMSRGQLLLRVELPLAAPLIVEGIRTAAVLVIGITTLTVFAGARNLGVLVFEGLGQFAPDLILLGALPIIVLAVAADRTLGALARALTPKGVRA